MNLSIVTPESKVFSGTVESVVLPGSEGQLGILPVHARLVTLLQPGEVCYRHENRDHYLVVGEGFAEITQESVTIMTDMAAEEREIDENMEQTAIERARQALAQADHTPEEEAAVRAVIAKSVAKLDLKRRRR
jgi:F-type H+-transporting ATPase subunit epsilon